MKKDFRQNNFPRNLILNYFAYSESEVMAMSSHNSVHVVKIPFHHAERSCVQAISAEESKVSMGRKIINKKQ